VALFAHAAAIIVGHNHPSGDPTPSGDDISLTARLARAGEILGIKVIDHVIVADGRYYSFKEGGGV
jgi:DNA repair protein RadC